MRKLLINTLVHSYFIIRLWMSIPLKNPTLDTSHIGRGPNLKSTLLKNPRFDTSHFGRGQNRFVHFALHLATSRESNLENSFRFGIYCCREVLCSCYQGCKTMYRNSHPPSPSNIQNVVNPRIREAALLSL